MRPSPALLRRSIIALLSPLMLAGCGVSAVGTAVTEAEFKKQEVQQSQAQSEAIQRQLQQAHQQGQQRQQAFDEATK